MRFWLSMLLRLVWLVSNGYCLYAAITHRQPNAMVWLGAASGFYAMGTFERNEQVRRGEVDE